MAIYNSLKSLTTNPRNSRTFFSPTAISVVVHPLFRPPSPSSSSPPQSPKFLSPLSKWIAPLRGPLFLSSPPWKLSQSATPLYLRGNVVVRRNIEALNLHLLRRRTAFPLKLKLAPVSVDSDRSTGGLMESFVNLPNMVSVSRIISGPVLGWMIVNEWYSYAMVGLAVSGATDWLDGYLARKMGINSVVGSYLDPLADKVLIGCVAVAMVHNDLLHPGLVGLVVFRDVGLVGGAVYLRAKSLGWEWKSWFDFFNLDGMRPQKVEPLFISKVNTVLQLLLVAGALLQPEFGTPETQSLVTYLSWLVASTTAASTAAYGVQYMRNRSMLMAAKS